MTKTIVFTDLDGTLLDAKTYSPEGSRSAVEALKLADVPLIFCSAKTLAEQLPIRKALGVRSPCIVENGSAIYGDNDHVTLTQPDGFVETKIAACGAWSAILGERTANIHSKLDQWRVSTKHDFVGYHDMTAEAVAETTGLSLEAARLAKKRRFSETIVSPFIPETLTQFHAYCAQNSLRAFDGGRFVTVTGANADKGKAVALLTENYRSQYGDVVTIGIGDSPNDAPMLAAVDHAYLVQRPDESWRDLDIPNLTRIEAVGPAGFSLATQVNLTF